MDKLADMTKLRFDFRNFANEPTNHTALNSSASSLVSNLKTPRHLTFTIKFKITSDTTSSELEYIYI